MSDDGQRKSSGGSFPTIPPELRPYMGKGERPKIQRRGEDPALDAAFASLEAFEVEEAQKPQEIDLTRGAGNASAYVAPIAVPAQGTKGAGVEKVEIAVGDAPMQLPAGDPTLETKAVETSGFRGAPLRRRAAVAAVVLLIGVAAAIGIWAATRPPLGGGLAEAASVLPARSAPPAPRATASAASTAPLPGESAGAAPSFAPSAAPSVSAGVAPALPLLPKQGSRAFTSRASAQPKATAPSSVEPVVTAVPSVAPPPALTTPPFVEEKPEF